MKRQRRISQWGAVGVALALVLVRVGLALGTAGAVPPVPPFTTQFDEDSPGQFPPNT